MAFVPPLSSQGVFAALTVGAPPPPSDTNDDATTALPQSLNELYAEAKLGGEFPNETLPAGVRFHSGAAGQTITIATMKPQAVELGLSAAIVPSGPSVIGTTFEWHIAIESDLGRMLNLGLGLRTENRSLMQGPWLAVSWSPLTPPTPTPTPTPPCCPNIPCIYLCLSQDWRASKGFALPVSGIMERLVYIMRFVVTPSGGTLSIQVQQGSGGHANTVLLHVASQEPLYPCVYCDLRGKAEVNVTCAGMHVIAGPGLEPGQYMKAATQYLLQPRWAAKAATPAAPLPSTSLQSFYTPTPHAGPRLVPKVTFASSEAVSEALRYLQGSARALQWRLYQSQGTKVRRSPLLYHPLIIH